MAFSLVPLGGAQSDRAACLYKMKIDARLTLLPSSLQAGLFEFFRGAVGHGDFIGWVEVNPRYRRSAPVS
jgi:hypothetical protein